MDWIYSQFGQRLRSARRRAALTQEQLSERAGLSRTSITNIERGRQRVALHTLFALASAVGAEPHALLPSLDGSGQHDAVPAEILELLSEDNREFVTRVIASLDEQRSSGEDS